MAAGVSSTSCVWATPWLREGLPGRAIVVWVSSTRLICAQQSSSSLPAASWPFPCDSYARGGVRVGGVDSTGGGLLARVVSLRRQSSSSK